MDRAWRKQAVRGLCLLSLICARAWALNPALDVSEYAHSAWKVRDGFVRGTVGSIAQTPDGYLWLGTEFGLLRFDGVRTVPWRPPPGQHLPSDSVFSLLAARDGTLWIGTSKGVASWKDGNLTQYPELAGQWVRAPILEDSEGTVWAGGVGFPPPAKLCAIHGSSVRCYGEDGRFVNGIRSVYEDRKRNLWVGLRDGLWRWKPGPPEFHPAAGPGMGIQGLVEGDDGALLFGPRTGIRRLVGAKIEAYPLPNSTQHFTISRLLRDRDANLWIATSDAGLAHVHNGRTDIFAQADGLTSDYVSALFEDREGSVWVGTHGGLDRFREFAVPTLSFNQGLSSASVVSLLADRDGSIWLSTRRGLDRWNNGRVTTFGLLNGNYAGSLFQDRGGRVWASTLREFGYLENGRFIAVKNVPGGPVYSITEDGAGSLWIANKDHGLVELLNDGSVQMYPWTRLGHNDIALSLAADPSRRGTWVGFYGGGIVYFAGGQVRASYSVSDGLGEGRVEDLRSDPDGTLWAATEGGVSRLKNGRLATLSSKNGLPCDSTRWTLEDNDHSFWLYMSCGLVRIARSELDAWAAVVDRDKDAKPAVHAKSLDSSDGVRTLEHYDFYTPHAAKSAGGRLWFLPSDGVSVLDPRHLPLNRLVPPVRIEQVTANHKTYDVPSHEAPSLRLPALVRDLEIDYTALSLVAPEKVLFRYKLDGYDGEWHDARNRRQAFYTNLKPKNYRFRVMACNNSGIWNEAGAFLDFSVAPTYYQTSWFQMSCGAAFLALFWLLYRYRLLQITREFNARLEGRVDERMRVARELHDTLLQSFHGVLPRLQAVHNLLPGRSLEAKEILNTTIDDAAQAITEARDAVHNLRSSTVVTNDLPKAVQALGEDLASLQTATNGNAATFSLELEGVPQDMHPILRDEIYRITAEAMRNAFKHARARRIEVEICYSSRNFRVRVRDDGAGIDANVLRQQGRAGHFGLAGMRERVEHIGGKLDIWSECGAGTEVELALPASVAYGHKPGRRFTFTTNAGSRG